MGADNTLDLEVKQGKTYNRTLQWESANFVWKPITAATAANPCVLTIPTHGMPDGWHFQIAGAKGMTKLNQDADTGLGANGLVDYVNKLVDVNTVELNDVAASDFSAYLGGGSIVYRQPMDLTGFTGRMMVKTDPEDAVAVLNLTTANGGVVIDNTLKTVTIVITDAQAAALAPGTYYYDLELVAPGPSNAVTELVHGVLEVPYPEVTT
jgi:hypothetical protein